VSVPSAVLEFEIYDARKVLAAVDKHWQALLAFRVTEEARARFRRALSDAERWDGRRHPAQIALDAARLRLKDALGFYRLCAEIAANPFHGSDPQAARALKVRQPFPKTDQALRRYCKGLEPGLQEHGRRLAQRSFSKQRHKELLRLAKEFGAALDALPRLRGEEVVAQVQRQAQLAVLREYCRYFRKAGFKALLDNPEQVDFDRPRVRPNHLSLVRTG
jgi:hypothetical protein